MEAKEYLRSCVMCGHRCQVNRLEGERGVCGAGLETEVSSSYLHHGEEPMISGTKGSGTIFLAYCCLSCAYCQNYEISQWEKAQAKAKDGKELAQLMLELQSQGAHNINLVSPTHYGIQILEALNEARRQGLIIPVVWNSGGYDSLELLEALAGQVDIYMPDFKYSDDEIALKYSGATNYVETAKAAIAEMFRQVGNMEVRGQGFGVRGMLVRHLVLPNNLSQSKEVLDYLASISKDIRVSIMSQYSPQHRAGEFPELSRKLWPEEYESVVKYAQKIGLHNLYTQELESSEVYLPDFKKEKPF